VQKYRIHVSVETMNCQRNIRRFFALVVTLIALPVPLVVAQSVPPQNPDTNYKLTFTTNLKLDPLQPKEIFEDQTGTAEWGNLQQLLAAPLYKPSITRNFPQFWRIRVPEADLPLDVKYKIVSDGNPGNPFNTAKLNLLNPPYQVLERDLVNKTVVVEGGVQFEFTNPSNFGKADTYQRQLRVCVQSKSSPCSN
jgi:hypothetical protein